MPQTSPMNWTILSTFMIITIMFMNIFMNEKTMSMKNSKSFLNLLYKSWNW